MMPAGSAQSEAQSINVQGSTAPSTSSTLVTSDDDPDILVLGFQELDLSTEALLYSTNTAREDAWCSAVFAGLGEKRSQYVKVRYPRNFGLFFIWPSRLDEDLFYLAGVEATRWDVGAGICEEKYKVVFQ